MLNAAEDAAVDLLLTTDRRIRCQQKHHEMGIAAVVNAATPGSYIEIEIHLS